jgi:hypothetical protein
VPQEIGAPDGHPVAPLTILRHVLSSQRASAALGLAVMIALSMGLVGSTARADDEPGDYLSAASEPFARATDTYIADEFCLPDLTVQSLARMFDGEPGGIIGADYPRTLALPNGNVLWTFQDARIRTANGARYVHNIGMIQVGLCFNILVGGSSQYPEAWLFPEHTAPEYRWFWPLDAALGSDGQVYVFTVEMQERGERYLERAEPGGVYIARFDPANWNIEWYGRPSDTSTALYGWSIETDDEWTYLFAHCHRQFGYDPVWEGAAHDRSCTQQVTVGRVRAGRIFDQPTYWTGRGWSSDRNRAVSLLAPEGRWTMPSQFLLKNGRWLAITKVDDWFGNEIVIHSAVHPGGPYVEVDRRAAPRKCDITDCTTYFSSWIDGQNLGGPRDLLITSLSHNRWDGTPSWVYRPTYDVVAPPAAAPTAAMRCGLGHCD